MANYISPPWNSKTIGETILLRILHEIGHVVNKHKGDAESTTDGLLIERKSNIWDTSFTGNEEEAWSFAFNFRKKSLSEYQKLKNICDLWTSKHKYSEKDWHDDYSSQFLLINKIKIEDVNFNVPDWVTKLYEHTCEN